MLILRRITAPQLEPISLATAKAHCRVDGSYDDALFPIYISAAREYAEKRLGKALISQTWQLSLDSFPWGGYRYSVGTQSAYKFANDYWLAGMSILLPMPPLIEVVSIRYLDETGNQHTLDPSTYIVDAESEPARIVPTVGTYWPYLQAYQPSGVQVTYTTGYGTDPDSVPADIQLALLMLIGHYYENREATAQGTPVNSIPLAVESLLAGHALTMFTYEGQ